MKVGAAVTTYGRNEHLKFWIKSITDFSPDDVVYHVANDNRERKGIAFRKTECLRELYNEGCDYFFLFDSDCFPIRKGWTDFFIDALNASGQNHFCYMVDSPATKVIETQEFVRHDHSNFVKCYDINRFDNCNGCLMVMTRKAVEKVGAFNPNYGMYGGEHGNWTHRCHWAGLNPMGQYLCPTGAEEYIYACDLNFHKPEIQRKLKHGKPSMSSREKIFHATKALQLKEDRSIIHIPL